MNEIIRASLRRLIFVIFPLFYAVFAQAQLAQCLDVFSLKEVRTRDGKVFEYQKLITDKGQSEIFRLDDRRILRLFKSDDPVRTTQRFVKGYEELQAYGVKGLTKILDYGKDWVIQEHVTIHRTFKYFILNAEIIKAKRPDEFAKLVAGLRKFSLSTVKFDDLGDFHSGQLIWTGKEWKLLDWNHLNYFAAKNSRSSFLQGLETPNLLIDGIFNQIHREIIETRNKQK